MKKAIVNNLIGGALVVVTLVLILVYFYQVLG